MTSPPPGRAEAAGSEKARTASGRRPPGGRAATSIRHSHDKTIFRVTKRKNPNFVGRDDTLRDLRETFLRPTDNARVQILVGLGGVGKSQIAVQYAETYRSSYAVVWWIGAVNLAGLQKDYAELAVHLQLVDSEDVELPEREARVRSWLESNNNWLLIFDDAHGPEIVAAHVPNSPRGHVLITSRDVAWRRIGRVLHVDVLGRAAAIQFLIRATGQLNELGAGKVAELLGDLPLAMEQASAYMDAEGVPFDRYIEMFQNVRSRIWERERAYAPPDHRDTVAITFELCIARVERISKTSMALLQLCAFFAPDRIPRMVFERSGGMIVGRAPQSLLGTMELGVALRALRQYSLVQSDETFLSVHKLVQVVTLDRMMPAERGRWLRFAADAVVDWLPSEQANPTCWPIYLMLLSHVQTIAEYAVQHTCGAVQIIAMLNYAGLFFKQVGLYSLGEGNFRAALDICATSSEVEPIDLSAVLGNLSGILLDMRRPEEAMQFIESAFENAKKFVMMEQQDPHLAQHFVHRGTALAWLGKMDDGLVDMDHAISIAETEHEADDPVLLYLYNSAGGLWWQKGDRLRAIEYFRRALKTQEGTRSRSWPIKIMPMTNLAQLLVETGKRKEAREIIETAVRIARDTYPDNHPIAAQCLRVYTRIMGTGKKR